MIYEKQLKTRYSQPKIKPVPIIQAFFQLPFIYFHCVRKDIKTEIEFTKSEAAYLTTYFLSRAAILIW